MCYTLAMMHLQARDVMTTPVLTISPDASLEEAIRLLSSGGVSGVPVVDSRGLMVGLISEENLLSFIFSGNLETTKVQDAMTTQVVAFPPETDLLTIAQVFHEHRFRRVPIMENNRVVGIVSRRNIIRAAIKS
jgi:CBS domain-containing protein